MRRAVIRSGEQADKGGLEKLNPKHRNSMVCSVQKYINVV